jgi:putative Ca2+/H+ antiporter (TMEM165/GDT1 family)
MEVVVFALFPALFIVFLAEMGDKTQLVALSFATKYKPMKVVLGIFIATLLVHLFSVAIGEFITEFIPMMYLELIIGLSFIGFAAWTLRGDSYDEDNAKASRYGAVMTVAIAFFIAELGDKTQLATVSLAAKYSSFIGVWLGSTLGMVIADGLAIVVGIVAGKNIPEKTIKFFSAGIFALFGVITIAQSLIS